MSSSRRGHVLQLPASSDHRELDVETQNRGGSLLASPSSLAFPIITEPDPTWTPGRGPSRNALRSQRSRSHSTLNGTIEIRAGTGENAKIFPSINRNLLCNASVYFSEVGQSIASERVELPEDDPEAVELFVKWINNQREPVKYDPDKYTPEPWPSKAVVTWVFARKIQARDFEKYALSQFIQNCSMLAFGPWEYIEKEIEPKLPLSRFSDHWVAWNSALAGVGENEFTGRAAVGLACFVTSNTRDPRTFDIEHWYSNCGNEINPKCLHDPIAKREFQEREAVVEEEPIDEWGRSFELKRQNASPAIPAPPPPSRIRASSPIARILPTSPVNPYHPPPRLVYTQPRAPLVPLVYPPPTSSSDDCAEFEECCNESCESFEICCFETIEDCFDECCNSHSDTLPPPRYF